MRDRRARPYVNDAVVLKCEDISVLEIGQDLLNINVDGTESGLCAIQVRRLWRDIKLDGSPDIHRSRNEEASNYIVTHDPLVIVSAPVCQAARQILNGYVLVIDVPHALCVLVRAGIPWRNSVEGLWDTQIDNHANRTKRMADISMEYVARHHQRARYTSHSLSREDMLEVVWETEVTRLAQARRRPREVHDERLRLSEELTYLRDGWLCVG